MCVSLMKSHPFHIVQVSPWPFAGSLRGLLIAIGFVFWFHLHNKYLLYLAFLILVSTIIVWWRDVRREGTYMGSHTIRVQSGLQLGILLFIVSEIIFFFAFFWGFFHSRLAPNIELGCSWPPIGVTALNPMRVPLLNTAVLLASGATVTWAHHGLLNQFRCELKWGLGVTIFLGAYFTLLQLGEYRILDYAIRDRVYGSTFFLMTGFHGAHVLIGTAFLFVCYARSLIGHFSKDHHLGLEFAAWYWHFVDVVWIFLFISIYWWAS